MHGDRILVTDRTGEGTMDMDVEGPTPSLSETYMIAHIHRGPRLTKKPNQVRVTISSRV